MYMYVQGVAELLNFRMGGDAKAIFDAVHLVQMGLNLINGKEEKRPSFPP